MLIGCYFCVFSSSLNFGANMAWANHASCCARWQKPCRLVQLRNYFHKTDSRHCLNNRTEGTSHPTPSEREMYFSYVIVRVYPFHILFIWPNKLAKNENKINQSKEWNTLMNSQCFLGAASMYSGWPQTLVDSIWRILFLHSRSIYPSPEGNVF